jgi:hypothetical protein
MTASEIQWTVVDETMISYSTPGHISDEHWDRFVKDLKAKPIRWYLSTTMGAVEVNSVQRKKCIDVLKSKGVGVAVVTDERVVRGIVTAASWLGVNVKAFPWTDINGAIQHIQVSREAVDRYVEAVAKLRQAAEACVRKSAVGGGR